MLPPQQKFAQTALNLPATAFGLIADALRDAAGVALGAPPHVSLSRLEARIGRSFTPQELQQLRTADNAKKAELSEIESKLLPQFVQSTGLSREQLLQLLPSVGI
jgi:hypothetical protein